VTPITFPHAVVPETATQTALHTSSAGAAASTAADRKNLDPKLVKAAQEFEAVFLRQLMKPLEKAGETGKGSSVTSGSSVYGSMMVGAVADSAAAGGGIGLSEMILKSLMDAGKAELKNVPGAAPASSLSPIKPNQIKSL
jgi:Rod binding domain-containing protein